MPFLTMDTTMSQKDSDTSMKLMPRSFCACSHEETCQDPVSWLSHGHLLPTLSAERYSNAHVNPQGPMQPSFSATFYRGLDQVLGRKAYSSMPRGNIHDPVWG